MKSWIKRIIMISTGGGKKTCGAHDCITFNASYSIIAATKWQRASSRKINVNYSDVEM
jgi:hypothetical protein